MGCCDHMIGCCNHMMGWYNFHWLSWSVIQDCCIWYSCSRERGSEAVWVRSTGSCIHEWYLWVRVVLCGPNPFHERGKKSGNFFYSSLVALHCTVQDRSQCSILSHTCWYHKFKRKLHGVPETTVKPSSCFVTLRKVIAALPHTKCK